MSPALNRIALLASLVLAVLAWQAPALADGGLDPADPMVRITAPHLKVDAPAVLAGVSRDVSAATGLPEQVITYYWQTFDAIHCMGEPATDKPVFVDLYVPGFFTDAQVAKVMTAIAESLAKRTGVSTEWVFIHTHFPLQGQVYISGHVDHWEHYRGQGAEGPRPAADRAMARFLFNDGAFVFQSLWRTGLIASGAADLGEVLTATSQVQDFDKESWYTAWNAMAQNLRAKADAYAAAGHRQSAMQAYFRASTYFRASFIYLFGNDPRGLVAWQNNREAFLKAASLSDGRITPVRIPYEKTTLPGYLVTPDGSAKKRPLLLIQTGLDGTAEDLYFILAAEAVKRGYNCLVYEGPGQGEMIVLQHKPFRHDWEKVVTPVVDFALTLPGVDPQRVALIGYSMGGYLVPRALAFEKRIRWAVADSGVMSVFEGTMTKFPAEVKAGVGSSSKARRINELALQEMAAHAELSQFINQMLWTFQAGSPADLFQKLTRFEQSGTAGKITAEMLVVNSTEDQVAGSNAQAKLFFNALTCPKTYMEFDASQGTQFHCQLGAPQASGERILNWLDDRARP
mgnify:CR=1 FL=1